MPVEMNLPPNYKEYKDVDMTRESPTYLSMNIFTAILLIFFFIVLSRYAENRLVDFEGAQFGGLQFWSILLVFLLAIVMMFVHEGLHWLSFKVLTGATPAFVAKNMMPRAILEEVYIPKGLYVLIKLLPTLLLTGLYFLLVPVLPLSWLEYAIYFFAGNIAYASSDLIMMAEALRAPQGTLVEDVSEHVHLYADERFAPEIKIKE